MKFNIFFIGILSLFISCKSGKSKDLSREQAKTAIAAKYPKLQKTDFETQMYNALAQREVPKYQKLQEEGYITYTYENWWLNAEVLEKSRPYLLGEERREHSSSKVIPVSVSRSEFGEITGILKLDENRAEVSYTERITATPFGKYIFNISDGSISKKVIFKKFDDGWRTN